MFGQGGGGRGLGTLWAWCCSLYVQNSSKLGWLGIRGFSTQSHQCLKFAQPFRVQGLTVELGLGSRSDIDSFWSILTPRSIQPDPTPRKPSLTTNSRVWLAQPHVAKGWQVSELVQQKGIRQHVTRTELTVQSILKALS